MSGEQTTDRILFDGQSVRAIEIDFEILSEDWDEYRLANGVRLRVKNVVTKVFLLVDDAGKPLLNENGEPHVVVNGSGIISTSVPVED